MECSLVDEVQDPKTLNKAACNALKRNVINSPAFFCVREDGCLGAHSFKKSGVTQPCKCSCFKDDVDTQGKWKGKK
eukprot:12472171-Ditylum_brightwellii.AAC.1